MEGVPSNNPSAGRCGCRGGSAPSLRSGGSRSVRGKCWTRGAAQRRGTGSAAGSVREAGSRAFGTESRGAVRCSPRALDPVGSGGKFRATAPKRPGNRRTAGGGGGCVSERLRAPQLWVPQCLGLGSRFLPTLPGPTNCSPSVSPKTSKPFGPLWEMGRPASPGQPSPGLLATHQVGQSNSGRLEPEFVAAAILRLPRPFGGPEARRETGRLGEKRHPSSLCVRARVRAHTRTRTHVAGRF